MGAIRAEVARIKVSEGRPLHIIEVCGGDTRSLFRRGCHRLVPDAIEFVHGPGCPVRVLLWAASTIASRAPRARTCAVFRCCASTSPGIRTQKALLSDPDHQIEGFIDPGHVSVIIGVTGYDFTAREHGLPLMVVGPEPLDILQLLLMVLKQRAEGQAEIENQDARIVPSDGNSAELAAMESVFEPRMEMKWRGVGPLDLADDGVFVAAVPATW